MTKLTSIDLATIYDDTSKGFSRRAKPVCLFVGDESGLRRLSLHVPQGVRVARCRIADVSVWVTSDTPPDVILSFPINAHFDCVELAQLLNQLGFAGRQRIVNTDLPAPQIVCCEVRQACPELDFGILDPAELRHF